MLTVTAEGCKTVMRTPVTVLLVDDHHTWRGVVRSLLLEDPRFHIVAEAVDGSDALQKVRQFEPDLVLLDINLPGLSGIEVARRIRELSANSKIIYVTQNGSAAVREAAMADGAVGYVTKSRALDELLPAMQAAIQ